MLQIINIKILKKNKRVFLKKKTNIRLLKIQL